MNLHLPHLFLFPQTKETMKLTNNLRDAFVRAAMADVPKVDYTEKARDLVNKLNKEYQIKAKIDKVDIMRLTSSYLSVTNQSFYVRGLTDIEYSELKTNPELKKLNDLHEAQRKAHRELEVKLAGAIAGCTTRKQAVDALPEFDKYLPEDTVAAMRSLPAIANVVTDFVKAGWPKTQKRITI